MINIIQQTVRLPASPEELFDSYLDSKRHSEITGSPVTIGRDPGSQFAAFGGALSGRILLMVAGRTIVQSWRSNNWKTEDLDSILIMTFSADPSSPKQGGRIDLAHVNVPDHDYDKVNEGWEKYYWTPWRRYLAQSRP